VYDRFECFQTLWLAGHFRGETSPIDPAIAGRTWESILDERYSFALIEPVHVRVGIEYGHAMPSEVSGG
jgi:hypothetical protein